MKREALAAVRYRISGGFHVDVVSAGGEVSFWLGHRDCDIQEKMFAASAAFAPEDRWESMIQEDLEDYLADFREAWLEA